MIYIGLLGLTTSPTNNKESWLIIGAGAIGLLWYAKLTDLKLNVCLLHRRPTPLKHLTVEEDNQAAKGYPLCELAQYQEADSNNHFKKQFDHIVFCTKSFDLINAYQTHKHRFSDTANLITLCNGMGAQQSLNRIKHASQSLFVGTTSEGALKLTDNKIRKTGPGQIYIGSFDSSRLPPAPLDHFFDNTIADKLLTKLAINAVINPLTACLKVTNGALLNPDLANLYQACRDEVTHYFATYDFDEKALALSIDLVAKNTANNRSSMLQDVTGNKQTEIDYISGYLIRDAAKKAIKLPIQTLLMDLIIKNADASTSQTSLLNLLTNLNQNN